jgi:putative oxidoreductase
MQFHRYCRLICKIELIEHYFTIVSMRKFPFLTLTHTLVLLRVTTALIFIAHAVVRITDSTVDQFGDFLNSQGFMIGVTIVWILTVFEIVGGLLMAFGFLTRWLALGFFLILLVGIIIIHAGNGWFVGEHGTGGMEYSVLLMVALFVIAADDKK